MPKQAVHAEVGGTVTRIERREGERVARDEPILFLELMKMEIPIVAPADAMVIKLPTVAALVADAAMRSLSPTERAPAGEAATELAPAPAVEDEPIATIVRGSPTASLLAMRLSGRAKCERPAGAVHDIVLAGSCECAGTNVAVPATAAIDSTVKKR